jgi:hypothetical protein
MRDENFSMEALRFFGIVSIILIGLEFFYLVFQNLGIFFLPQWILPLFGLFAFVGSIYLLRRNLPSFTFGQSLLMTVLTVTAFSFSVALARFVGIIIFSQFANEVFLTTRYPLFQFARPDVEMMLLETFTRETWLFLKAISETAEPLIDQQLNYYQLGAHAADYLDRLPTIIFSQMILWAHFLGAFVVFSFGPRVKPKSTYSFWSSLKDFFHSYWNFLNQLGQCLIFRSNAIVDMYRSSQNFIYIVISVFFLSIMSQVILDPHLRFWGLEFFSHFQSFSLFYLVDLMTGSVLQSSLVLVAFVQTVILTSIYHIGATAFHLKTDRDSLLRWWLLVSSMSILVGLSFAFLNEIAGLLITLWLGAVSIKGLQLLYDIRSYGLALLLYLGPLVFLTLLLVSVIVMVHLDPQVLREILSDQF